MNHLPIAAATPATRAWLAAFDAPDIDTFMQMAFPPHWSGIRARILESGATFAAHDDGLWAPRWTPIPRTLRVGRADDETRMRSIFYRVHDCLHNLWGLPHPHDPSDPAARRAFVRAVMAGEVAVLTLTEFVFADWVHATCPELRTWIDGRCALQMRRGPLAGRSPTQIALRLDEAMHKGFFSAWSKEHRPSADFFAYYTPMLAADRTRADACWRAIQEAPEAMATLLETAPRARFGDDLNGMELTAWMLADHEHLLSSAAAPDHALVAFNRARRAELRLPDGWPR